MTSKTTYIPRFLLPQYGPMWRAAVRSAAFARPLNGEVGQVMVRYASQMASRRPSAAKSAVTKATAQRTASSKTSASSKAAKHSAPTKPPPKTVKTSAPNAAAPQKAAAPAKPATPITAPTPAAREPVIQAVAPKPAAAPPVADPSKPIVLEKPERFNPPSHGSRLPRSTPRHYGGSLTAEEVQAQNQRIYPGLPPPPNTWSHWFINSRGIHLFITLGTLTSLAFYTFCVNFKAKSPFADMVPPISEFPRHPFQYIGVCIDVLRMHEEHESALTAEKRRRKVDDVTKRNEYRKAHGLEPATSGLFGSKAVEAPKETVDDASPQATAVVEASEPEPNAVAAEITPEGKRKKFMGIF
ncbi:hypothetical protein FHL15_006276 [Xylaria flabelliformis]|uniref:Uncharacterized protein n=1 Tax=Xylaria flabelliformis TaxID=2512241 RepID=A0A553HY39_9PEZI|nr:hypothetical protein FHL15_006276 [Xylaria flabelliformis]